METLMTTSIQQTPLQVICEIDASPASNERIEAALNYSSKHGAEITFVWVFDPRAFASTTPVATGGIGTWGLPLILGRAVERARERALTASSLVLIGAREQVLDRAEDAANADALYTTATQIVRCPQCGWRHDPRGIHFCPTVHLAQASHPAEPTGRRSSKSAVRRPSRRPRATV
jgi:nucleotide-binding universal stress UspA family protein